MASSIKKFSSCCENEGFQPCLLELKDKNTGNQVTLDVNKGTFTCKDIEDTKYSTANSRTHST